MANPYTLLPGYSGPFLYDATQVVEPVIADVFARSSIKITKSPTTFPATLRSTIVPITVTLDTEHKGWKRIRNNLKAGLYRWTYISGAITEYVNPVPILGWNQGYPGEYSGGNPLIGPTAKPWLRSNADPKETFWFTGFDFPGYPTADIAESFFAKKSMLFEHVGGPLDIAYDSNELVGPAQGSIVFTITEVPLPEGDGFWAVVYSSLPIKSEWPTIAEDQRKKEFPVITNLKPGVHLVTFNTINYARTYTRQEYWIWVWKTQPRNGPTDSIMYSAVSRDKLRAERYSTLGAKKLLPWETMPNKPAKSGGNKVGTPLINRAKLMQPHKTSGVDTERPTTDGHLPVTPEKLGSGEEF